MYCSRRTQLLQPQESHCHSTSSLHNMNPGRHYRRAPLRTLTPSSIFELLTTPQSILKPKTCAVLCRSPNKQGPSLPFSPIKAPAWQDFIKMVQKTPVGLPRYTLRSKCLQLQSMHKAVAEHAQSSSPTTSFTTCCTSVAWSSV